MAKMMKLADKDVKTAIINSLHMFKKVEKKTRTWWGKKWKIQKKDPNGVCRDLKHILPKVKYITSGIKSISDTSKVKINEFKGTSIVATQSTHKATK